MTEVSKYVNLLIEYGQKIEGQLHKKYRPFLKSIINLKDLAKNVNPQSIKLTNEIIIFKLGIESKSVKSIEISLNFLLRLFKMGFVDLNEPNYCEAYEIGEAKIEKKNVDKFQTQMKQQFVRLLAPLVHFKNNQINSTCMKIYEHLIAQNILLPILDISEQSPSKQTYELILSYCSYRIYLFEEAYAYTEDETAFFKNLPRTEKMAQQIQNAMDREESLSNLIERYVEQIVSKVAEEGGKYGTCVICNQPADFFCKITRASLCGLECKKKHLQIAEKEYRTFYQSQILWAAIQEMMTTLCTYLAQKQSSFLFSVLAKILQVPSLFMLVRSKFKSFIRSYVPKILDRVYQSKCEQSFETLHFFMSYLAKWWPTQTLIQIEYFLKQNVVKVLSDKKPNFRHLMLTFKSINEIFECGKTVVELFINLDCEVNRPNLIGQILFELSKIAQDKFQNSNSYSKQEKIAMKNSCVTLFLTLSKALNEYRRIYPEDHQVSHIIEKKQRKNSLEQFIDKFNEHWSQGLKSLFNLNIVGLDSNQQIVNIVMTMHGLKKEKMDEMLFDKNCKQYLEIFMFRLSEQPQNLISKLLQFYQYLPLTNSASVAKKNFCLFFQDIFNEPNLSESVNKLTDIFTKAKNLQDFCELIKNYCEEPQTCEYYYRKVLNARKALTPGTKNHYYQLCMSHKFLEVISSQISLLQIPLSYLLQTSYPPQKIIHLIRQLIPICRYSNWLSLLSKNSMINEFYDATFTQNQMKLLKGALDIVITQANFIVEWQSILCLMCNLHLILIQNASSTKKIFYQNHIFLTTQISVSLLDSCLINCSLNVKQNFESFLRAVLFTARDQLNSEHVFLLQKFFQILDVNLDKYLQVFDSIFGEFVIFVKQLKPDNNETLIYICDMMKQFLLKLLKSEDLQDRITEGYFGVFHLILQKTRNQKAGKEVGDFVMNCLSTIIMHHYRLKPNTWQVALKIMEEYARPFPYQTGVMVRKILNEKMQNLHHKSQRIIKICLELLDPSDEKASIQSIHNIKMVIDYKDLQTNRKEQEGEVEKVSAEKVDETRELLEYSLQEMINFLDKSFNEPIIEVMFNLFNFSINKIKLLTHPQIHQFFRKAFSKLEFLPLQQQESGRRILNQSLYWCVKNGVYEIIKNFQELIVNKFTYISIDALKCIKTYIQMANPRDEQQWKDIESTLLAIIVHTQIIQHFKQEIPKFPRITSECLLKNQHSFDKATAINIQHFKHKCKLQAMAVQLLPNDQKCLQILIQAYDQKVQFNDHLQMRIGLWKQGIGRESPPELLALEQIISNRIMAIYLRVNTQKEILKFCTNIFERYLQASQKLNQLQNIQGSVLANCNDPNYEFYIISLKYWEKRRLPMLKLICYILPKLPKFCFTNQQRKQMLKHLAKMLPVVEKRDPFLKSMKELAKKKYD